VERISAIVTKYAVLEQDRLGFPQNLKIMRGYPDNEKFD
jgi:hypothetical protein